MKDNVKEFLKEYNELIKRHGIYIEAYCHDCGRDSDDGDLVIEKDGNGVIAIKYDIEKKAFLYPQEDDVHEINKEGFIEVKK